MIQDCLDAVLFSPKIDYVGADIDTWLLNTNSSDDISSTTVYSSERLSNKMLVYIEHINQLLTEELLKQELLLEKSSKCPQDHKNQNQVILILSFGFGFSGKSIGKKLGINQSTVSRRCQKIEEKLLMVIASWMQEISNINLSEIKNLDTYIKQWIIAYYKEKIDLVIQEKFDSNLSNQTKDVIRAYYFQIEQNNQTIKQKKQAITQRLNITRKELNEQLETAKNQLLNDLCNWLENELSIEIHETEDIEKVKKVLETWLTNSHLTY